MSVIRGGEKITLHVRTQTPNRVIRTDPRVNCREVSTRSQALLLGISLVNGRPIQWVKPIISCRRFVGIDSANPGA
jgi:hypothetical protein